MRPIYAFRSENEIAKDLRTLERRLRDRMIPARMAVPFLQEVEPGERPKLPKSIKWLSLNEMAAFVAEEAEQSEPHNGAHSDQASYAALSCALIPKDGEATRMAFELIAARYSYQELTAF